jgi:hypothetical protein
VGVLPKKLKPVQLEKVLIQLKLVPSKETEPEPEPEPEPSAAVHAIKTDQVISTKGSQHSLEELSRSASEDQEKDSMRLLFRQLFSEQRDSIKQDQWQLVAAMTEQVTPIVLATRNKIATWQKVALSGLCLFLTSILVLLYGLVEDGDLQQKMLQQQLNEQESILIRLDTSFKNAQLSQEHSIDNLTEELNVKPIEWAINHHPQLSFYQTLNSISTQSYVTELINQLDDFGFNGSLYIQFHSGRFCQQKIKGGQQTLVSAERSISQCQFNLQDVNTPGVLADFEDLLISINQNFPHINLVFESIGSELTLQGYPEMSDDVTAGQWNKIARRNNRFNFVLVNEG